MPVTAGRYLRRIYAAMESLKYNPRRYRVRREILDGIRVMPVGSALIVYEIEDEHVHVLRLFTAGQDYTRILRGKPSADREGPDEEE